MNGFAAGGTTTRLTGMAFFAAAAILFASLAILRPAQIGSVRPGSVPPLRTGVAECASCGMTIEDARFAAGRLVKPAPDKATTLLYDDLGCMLDADRANEGGEAQKRYVQDFNGTGWIDAKRAWFVFDSQKNRTPMGSGILAFRERPRVGGMRFGEVAEKRRAYMKAKYGGE
ncbi:MAG: nitrous oxide reductase accessory protein NosL [Phycisphaerae bacterium]|nr:nitrous oxide reductase accessory protein NosL [Phycisphaerae bacterium]